MANETQPLQQHLWIPELRAGRDRRAGFRHNPREGVREVPDQGATDGEVTDQDRAGATEAGTMAAGTITEGAQGKTETGLSRLSVKSLLMLENCARFTSQVVSQKRRPDSG